MDENFNNSSRRDENGDINPNTNSNMNPNYYGTQPNNGPQNNPNYGTNHGGQKKKGSVGPIIVLIIVIVLIVCGVMVVKKNASAGSADNGSPRTSSHQMKNSSINMKNMENAKNVKGVKVNTSPKVAETKTYQGLTFQDVKVNSENGETNLVARVTNSSDKKTDQQTLKITCLKKDGSQLGNPIYISVSSLEPGKSITASATTSDDYVNMYDFKIGD